jgi:hypothetical protein
MIFYNESNTVDIGAGYFPNISLDQWFSKCGAQEILKGGARGVKLFYSLKINKKTQE